MDMDIVRVSVLIFVSLTRVSSFNFQKITKCNLRAFRRKYVCQCTECADRKGLNVIGNECHDHVAQGYKPRDICDIRELESETGLTVRRCDKATDGFRVCYVSDGESINEYKCIEESWKLSTGTDHHGRQKRFIGLIIGAIVGLLYVAALVAVIYCDASGKCVERREDPEEVYRNPPEYTFCPESGAVYTASSKEKSVKVTWEEPIAEDDEEVVSETQNYYSGDEFEGSPDGLNYIVTYTAKDGYELTDTCSFSFTVKYISCDTRDPPMHGRQDCSHEYIYGSECVVKCYDGYEIVDGDTATCQEDETWNDTPLCQKSVCLPPFNITNGEVTCEDELYRFESDCSFECDSGFTLDSSPRRMECQADKTWSVEASSVTCTDNEPPNIECLTPQIFYADRGGFTTSVDWEEPSATDNVDIGPVIRKLSNISQGDILSEGYHSVLYEASDQAGNTLQSLSECTITLEVKVIKCSAGPVDALENPRFISYNCSDTIFYDGVSCDLECELNLPINGSDRMSCERNGTTGKGVWVWDSEAQPFCEVVTCPPLDPPANGAFTTDSVNAVPLHVMFCKEGYDIPAVGSAFHGRLSCQDSGEWYPLSEFPDCIVTVFARTRLPAELIYTGDCNDESTQEIIKQQVLVYLAGVIEDVDKSICPDPDTCKTENVVVVCGANSGKRRKRQIEHGIRKRQDENIVVKFDIMVVFDARNKTAENVYLDILEFYKNVTDLIEVYIDERKFDIQNLSVAAFNPDSTPDFVCTDSGYKFEFGSLNCKPCPKGTYLNSTTDTCELCNIGEYMDHDAATTCDACPYGYSTLGEGSKNISSCIKLCSPGFISSTSMEPCFACPVGTYQPLLGRTNCESCPYGTATNGTNSTSAGECDVFDVFIGKLGDQSLIGTFYAEDTPIMTLSFWLRPINLENSRLSIYINDVFGEIINMTFSDHVSVVFGTRASRDEGLDLLPVYNPLLVSRDRTLSLADEGCVIRSKYSNSHNISDETLTKDQWTHIACTFNIASGSMQLYIGGKLTISETQAIIDPSRTISQGTVEMENLSKGIYLSWFLLYTRYIDQSDVNSFLQSCAVTATDEIFSMTDMVQNLVQGSSIILPTTCDPIDECETGPCGNHTCLNKVDGFECICHNGMTGPMCDIPPNYCLDNKCVNGECVSVNGTYKCNCADGYTGAFCSKPPVNGGWSEWQVWSSCSVTCGGGTRERIRKCNDPLPGFMGLDCEGSETEIEECNGHTCPSCPRLNRKYGTIVTCIENVPEENLECNMTCINGKVLTSGQRPYEKYRCGPTTGYIWEPTDKMPACVDATVPDVLGTRVSVSYTNTVPDSDADDVISSVEQKFTSFQCDTCQLTSTVVSNNLSKRSTSSTLTLQFSKQLTGDGDIALADYLTNGTETPAMSELLDTFRSINEIAEYIQTNTTTIFDVSVNGVTYTSDSSSISFAGTVTCADGYAGAGGLCAQCATGTKLSFPDCVSCEIGTYQPFEGQNECLPCPDGYTTSSFGASNISECSVIAHTSPMSTVTSKEVEKGNDEDNKTTVLVVVVVVGVVSISLIAVIALVMWKKHARRRFAIDETVGSLTSLNMVRPDSRASSVENANTSFQKEDLSISPHTQLSYENAMYGANEKR